MKILLFIPAYNCEKQILRVLEKIKNKEHQLQVDEILVINNQSQDKTLENALKFKEANKLEKLKVVTNSLNIGLGGTHKMAFQYAIDHNFDGCIILHGDDQGNIGDFPKGKDFLGSFTFGSRFAFKSTLINYSKIRILGNLIFNFMASLLSLKIISDFGGSGLNYFPTKLLKEHDFWHYPDDLTFHANLFLNILKLKQRYTFFPLTWSESDQVSNVKLVKQTIKLFKILAKSFTADLIVDSNSKANSKNYASWIYS